jgi:UDP-glucuronate 4-epimerase
MKDRKILVTGATGIVASPIAAWLARDNEVWGAARYGSPESIERSQRDGVVPVSIDLAIGDFSELPDDFDHVLHFGFMRGGIGDFDRAMTVNGEGTGLILKHCRKARSALVVSSAAIYTPHDDPFFAHVEDGPLGRAFAPWSPTSPVTKVAEEAVARFCARAFDLPITIARLNTVYGVPNNLLSLHIHQILRGETVTTPWDPNNHSPIHVDDICAQIAPLLAAASIPARIVNWAGDEVISAQYWCELAARWGGQPLRVAVKEIPGAPRGNVADIQRRTALTGPCKVSFDDGFRRLFDAERETVK